MPRGTVFALQCARSWLGQTDDEPTLAPAERLLSDIRDVWTGEQVSSRELVARLKSITGGPWRAIFPDPARAGIELAKYLAPDIAPVKIWLPEEQRSAQGYKRAQFGELLDDNPEDPEVDHDSGLQSSGPSGSSGLSES